MSDLAIATPEAAPETDRSPGTAAVSRTRRYRVLVVGGGSGGLTVAARLRRLRPGLEVAVLEPSQHHDYQPLWTLVGGGVVAKETSRREQRAVVPAGVTWLQEAAATLLPEDGVVVTAGGEHIGYDALVVCPGIRIDWDRVPGLREAMRSDAACSIYGYEEAERVQQQVEGFRGGTAVFTFPSTPVKCPGAPQKIMYLADEQFRRNGVREGSRIVFVSAAPRIFAIERYARTLEQVIARKEIETLFRHELVAVRPEAREAVVRSLGDGTEQVISYDLLHATPPQSAPELVAASPLADERGWVEVDRASLQHVRYPNVFSLGDASSLPTSKTAAAIRAQAPVLAANLLAQLDGRSLPRRYDGYTACPLVTGRGKLVLAEFDYDGTPRETFPFDQSKERWSMYQLKRYVLPRLYWDGMLRGRA